ncbi:MAG: dicarboxylate/amino acid:cation symporter, partial [Legionellales bacterium]|nr:dicarboxylate/amino acid:cation symporter [Legionellales bacterium]
MIEKNTKSIIALFVMEMDMESTIEKPRMALHVKMFISMFLAVSIGLFIDTNTGIMGLTFYSVFDFIGTVFINSLKMIIVPLVVSSIVTGITRVGGSKSLGRIGGKTMMFYMTTSFFAILTGLIVVHAVAPGKIDGLPAGATFGVAELLDTGDLGKIGSRGLQDVVNIFHRMIPSNVVAASAEGNMLGLIFFSLLFGFFMCRIPETYRKTIDNFWHAIYETMMLLTLWVMRYIAPVGIFGLIAKTMTETGFSALKPLFVFFITVILALSIHIFVTLSILLRVFARVNPISHFKAMIPALVTAFSTSSSSATLPMTMECVEKNANVSTKTASFVLPLGATINMDGTALYECVVAIFLMQLYGLDVSFTQQLIVLMLALITSIGVAGIPAASLVAI